MTGDFSNALAFFALAYIAETTDAPGSTALSWILLAASAACIPRGIAGFLGWA